MSKKVEPSKPEVYELTYKTTCVMKVLVQAPSRKAAETWSENYGDEFIDDMLTESDNEWDEQEGGFEEVVKLKKAEAEGAEPHVVVDDEGEPIEDEEDEEEEEEDDGEDAEDEEEDDEDK